MTDGEYHEGRDSLNKIFFNITDNVAELSKYDLYFYSALISRKSFRVNFNAFWFKNFTLLGCVLMSVSYYPYYLTMINSFSVSEPPEPPSAVFLSDVTSRSAKVSWYPAYDGNTPILGYMVQYRNKLSHFHKNVSVSGTATTTTLTG